MKKLLCQFVTSACCFERNMRQHSIMCLLSLSSLSTLAIRKWLTELLWGTSLVTGILYDWRKGWYCLSLHRRWNESSFAISGVRGMMPAGFSAAAADNWEVTSSAESGGKSKLNIVMYICGKSVQNSVVSPCYDSYKFLHGFSSYGFLLWILLWISGLN